MTTGDRLTAKLAESGISKKRLARESQVSYKTVCRCASGNRVGNLDTWIRFAEVIGCEVSELVGE